MFHASSIRWTQERLQIDGVQVQKIAMWQTQGKQTAGSAYPSRKQIKEMTVRVRCFRYVERDEALRAVISGEVRG